MKISTSIALLCLASLASAQTKGPSPVKDPNQGGYFPPPGGTSFLVVGGSDNCANASTADAISGNGTFAVTTVGATNGTPDAVGCVNTQLDVWFFWTAGATGSATLSLCGGATADTVVTVWPNNAAGACPTGTTSIACNDDFCGLQSQVTFPAVSGTSYFFQLGAFGSATTYSGTFAINIAPPPPPVINDSCAMPIAFNGPSIQAFDLTGATTGTEGQAEAICLFFTFTSIVRDAWWSYTATSNGTATVQTCAMLTSGTDTKIAVYNGSGCPTAAAIACVDDSCALMTSVSFPIVCGQTYTIQLGGYAYTTPQNLVGMFNLTEAGTACGPVTTPYCFGDGTGTACPCGNTGAAGNGCANSLNANGGNLTSTGNPSISADTFVLQGSGMPNSSVLYFQGTSQISVAFGDGLRCAGGTVIRLGTKNNVGGASAYPTGADTLISIRGLNVAGNVRTYQAWYRNAAAFCTPSTFNLTNGLEATWTP